MDITLTLAQELNLKPAAVQAAIDLIDEGNTIPFIARYRKEATGGMDDVALRTLGDRLTYLRNLEQRKEDVIILINAQGKLTPELEAEIRSATQLQRVEDLYKPYRKKRQTRAQKAREAGLEPLANMIIMQVTPKGGETPLDAAAAYVTAEAAEAGYDTPEKALAGAQDIVAETVAEDPENVADLRSFTEGTGEIVAAALDADEKTPYEPYYDFSEPARKIPNHRILAIDRGEREGKLRVRVGVDTQAAVTRLGSRWPRRQGPFAPVLDAAIADGYKRLMAPSLERELRAKLTVRAQTDAIKVFGKNLENLLSARPVRGARVIALDPGFRTGCKVAVLDETGLAGDISSGRTRSVAEDPRLFEIELSCPDDALTIGALSSASFMMEWAFLHPDVTAPDFAGTVEALRQLVLSLRGESEPDDGAGAEGIEAEAESDAELEAGEGQQVEASADAAGAEEDASFVAAPGDAAQDSEA